MVAAGYLHFRHDVAVTAWADVAHAMACEVLTEAETHATQLRHAKTWFVGVDALPNARDGSVEGVPLNGPWLAHINAPDHWHAAQLSVVLPGYPGQDPAESDANHHYRIKRHAAHVDGLLPVGPERRRFLQEPHAFILGLPLNYSDAAPLMVWPGSHIIMGDAFRSAIGQGDPTAIDLTETYHAARRYCFETITPLPVPMNPGQSVLLHRHLLHGVSAWAADATAPPEGRMIAYFRPQFAAQDWLIKDEGLSERA